MGTRIRSLVPDDKEEKVTRMTVESQRRMCSVQEQREGFSACDRCRPCLSLQADTDYVCFLSCCAPTVFVWSRTRHCVSCLSAMSCLQLLVMEERGSRYSEASRLQARPRRNHDEKGKVVLENDGTGQVGRQTDGARMTSEYWLMCC